MGGSKTNYCFFKAFVELKIQRNAANVALPLDVHVGRHHGQTWPDMQRAQPSPVVVQPLCVRAAVWAAVWAAVA